MWMTLYQMLNALPSAVAQSGATVATRSRDVMDEESGSGTTIVLSRVSSLASRRAVEGLAGGPAGLQSTATARSRRRPRRAAGGRLLFARRSPSIWGALRGDSLGGGDHDAITPSTGSQPVGAFSKMSQLSKKYARPAVCAR